MAKAYKCDMCEVFFEGYAIIPQGKRMLNRNLNGYAGLYVKPRRADLSGAVNDVLFDYSQSENHEIDICQDCLTALLQDLVRYLPQPSEETT